MATLYRRLVSRLSSRAERLGSKDPEAAAQETLRRSLENPKSRPAIRYYFSDKLPPHAELPAWPLDQLLAWLHGVLQFVVREEQNRVGYRREVLVTGTDRALSGRESALEIADPAADQLALLIAKETQKLLADCLPQLEGEYRKVLGMRASGLKYGEIAARLGVNENTVATWVSRGIRALARHIRERTEQPLQSTTKLNERGGKHV